MYKYLYFLLISFVVGNVSAQNVPIGQWAVHVPYNSAVDLVTSSDKIWTGLEASVLVVDQDDFSIDKYTKANGLSDVQIAALGYDETTDAVIIAYKNANIDIIEGKTVTNLPAVKNATIVGSKVINKIHTNNGFAWLACGFGIVKIDIERKEISDTYFVGVGNSNLQINDIWANENFVFAATEDGVIRGTIADNINLSNADDSDAWKRFSLISHQIPDASTSNVSGFDGKVYATIEDEVFSVPIDDTIWTSETTFTNWQTRALTTKNGLLYFAQELEDNGNISDARIGSYDGTTFSFIDDNNRVVRPRAVDIDKNGGIWFADFFQGCVNLENGSSNNFVPNGPFKSSVFKMKYSEGSTYVASSNLSPTLPGGDDDNFPNGLYVATEQNWNNINQFNASGLQGSFDIAVVEPIPAENKLLVGTDGAGVIELDLATGNGNVLLSPPNSSSNYRCIATTTDNNNNVWFTNALTSTMPLACRKPGGAFVYFTEKTGSLLGKTLNDLAVDEFNQIWISTSGSGVYVYNYNGTIDDQSDDELKAVGTSFGLPTQDARCLVADKDGEIWIGTSSGIGVVFCPGSIIDNSCPVSLICIPRNDSTNFCDNLFENEIVNCIAVDPANRKWIGTNGGLFLQSADGEKTIYSFNEDNSPLLSNVIRSISVDEQTGDVYIGTSKGINSFRAEATLTDEENGDDPYVFPNPVRPDYDGLIAIRNLANNSNVKIMDVAGHVVFETQATGGQAVWNGKNLDGDRVQTGVYIVLSASDDGKVKKTAKFVYVN